MPLLHFDALTEHQGQEHFRLTVERHPAVVASFRSRAALLGHDPASLDASPDSLVEAWRVYRQWWDDGAQAGPAAQPPPWVVPSGDPDEHIGDLTIGVLGVVDELGHYLAEVALQNVPGCRWRIARKPKRFRYAFQNMPVVTLGEADLVPHWPCRVLAMRLYDGENREDEALLDIYKRQTKHLDARAETG